MLARANGNTAASSATKRRKVSTTESTSSRASNNDGDQQQSISPSGTGGFGEDYLQQKLNTNTEVTEEEVETEELEIAEDTVINEAELDSEWLDEDEIKGQPSEVTDPFTLHFEREMSPQMQLNLEASTSSRSRLDFTWSAIEHFIFTCITKESFFSNINHGDGSLNEEPTISLDRSTIKLLEGPILPSISSPVSDSETLLQSLFIKRQIHSNILSTNLSCIEKSNVPGPLTPAQADLLALMGRYHDIYFPQRSLNNEEEIRNAYCFHVANHIVKTRGRILHHNARMLNKVDVPDEFRDQSFVRPKVLILVPFKESALRVVKALISTFLSEEKGNVQNKKRFVSEFSGETLFMPKTNPKPEDYMATFAGNTEDNFKIGLAITKKSIKLYTAFYASDIIVASPLGLRLIIGAEGEKNRDFDFLSSIEVLIMDQADIFLMQSWDHILHVMKHLHLQPATTHGTDFGRIRTWAIDGQTKFYCQTLIFSSISCPEHNALLSKRCKNFAGLAKINNPTRMGTIVQIASQLPQVFHQFQCETVAQSNDARFEYFITKVLPNFTGKLMSHTMIFVSSYFDFVRLRNYLKKEETSFVQICEYTKDKKIARARDLFFHGQNHFLVYTERAHFFRRFRLKGVGHLIFYQLPQYPQFYSELCNSIQSEYQNRRVRQRNNNSVNVVYCKYDGSRLAAIIGEERSNYMLSSDKNIHAFPLLSESQEFFSSLDLSAMNHNAAAVNRSGQLRAISDDAEKKRIWKTGKYFWKAELHLEQGNIFGARASCNQGIRLDPTNENLPVLLRLVNLVGLNHTILGQQPQISLPYVLSLLYGNCGEEPEIMFQQLQAALGIGIPPGTCPICQHNFGNRHNAIVHVIRQHVPSLNLQPYHCQFPCLESFAIPIDFTTHLQANRGDARHNEDTVDALLTLML